MIHANKITVMQVLPALEFGGVERGTLEIARELVRRGHRSIVVSAGGRMISQLQDEGSEHLQLPVGKKSPFSIRLIPTLKTLFNDNNVDIVHARSRFPAWLSFLALQGLKAPPRFITTVHGVYSINRYSSIMVRGEKVIAISEFVKKYIMDNYAVSNPDNIHVIPRGVDPAFYCYNYQPTDSWLQSWNEQFPETRDKRLVTLPGRITRRKGHEDFLEIFKLIKSDDSLHGVIIGGADKSKKKYLHRLKVMIKESGLNDRITLTGHRNDLREIYCRSDVVLSLAKDPEAFGRTSLEALSLGVPVIAYDHGGAGEVLGNLCPDGLVPVGDLIKTADLILGFINNPPHVKSQQIYSLQAMQRMTLSLYESLVRD
ncbi:MAG: glycosyltransferase family 4 protein [Gammaproteobacteria bacterium]|nr:glycosyltransferase family 4 protein [Gammaproteobacteria bacterium]